MRRMLVPLLAAAAMLLSLLCAAVFGEGPVVTARAPSVVAARTGKPAAAEIDVYHGVVLTANVDHEVKTYLWLINAPDRSWIPAQPEEGGRRVRFAEGDLEQPGKYLVVLVAIEPNGAASYAAGSFVISESPSPNPPPPPPPDKIENMTVLVVEEKTGPWRPQDKQPAEYLAISESRKVEEWLRSNDHRIYRRDQHSQGPDRNVPTELAPWFQLLGDSPLPYVFLVDDFGEADARAVWRGPLPESEAEFLLLVQKWGAGQ